MTDTALITATTKLEAVNWALKALGFTQVTTLDGTIGRDASAVVTSIDTETRRLCRLGYWFSTRDVTLTPDGSQFLVLPSNVLSIGRPSRELSGGYFSDLDWRYQRPVMRQGKVFSMMRQAYTWTNPLPVSITEALSFEDTPDEARAYVMVYAALEVNHSILRSDDVAKRLEPLMATAWNTFLQADIDNSLHRFL